MPADRLAPLRRRLEPLQVRDYRRIWAAGLASGLGDWAGTLALALMVQAASGSASLTAAVVTMRLVAWLGPGQVLTARLEHLPRRSTLVAGDLVRAVLYLVAATGALPVWGLLVLSALDGLVAVPFNSARAAVTPDATGPELYGRAIALSNMTFQVEVLVGSALGGIIAAVVGPQLALVLDAATFLVSSAFLARLTCGRERNASSSDGAGGFAVLVAAGRQMAAAPVLRACVLLALAYGSAMAVQALAVPHAAGLVEAGAPLSAESLAGLLAGVLGAGALLGSMAARAEGEHHELLRAGVRHLLVCFAGGAVLLVASHLLPSPLAVVAALLGYAVAGAGLGASVPVGAVFGLALPVELRSTGFSLAMGSLRGWQGALAAAAGVVAQVQGAGLGAAVACAAALGLVAVAAGASRAALRAPVLARP